MRAGRLLGFLGVLAATWVAEAQVQPLLPVGIAYDSAGNLYFADVNRNQVLEATLAGTLVVIAGNGTQGFSGDGGAATAATLNAPQGVAVGADGTVYIADSGNQRVRAVSAGVMTTFAGNGVRGFTGDGGAATAASLNGPNSLALDASGALLVCDGGNHRVRRVSGGVIATFAGSGVQGFSGDGGLATAAAMDSPMGVAVGPDGRVYIADTHNDRIRVVATSGVIATFAGTGVRGYAGDGGAATAANLSRPQGVVVTTSGVVLFADENNQRVRSVDASGVISTVAGDGVQGSAADGTAAGAARLSAPRGVGVSSFGGPMFADAGNRLLRGVASNGGLYAPAGLAAGRASSVVLKASGAAVYGQAAVAVAVTGSVGTPQGRVTVAESGLSAGAATLSGGAATVALVSLPAGAHTLTAAYAGDGMNPAAASSPLGLTVAQAPVVATANAVVMDYGSVTPPLTGSLAGVLAQDAGSVNAVFATTAPDMAAVGSYPVTASITGAASANYALTLATNSGQLTVVRATSSVTASSGAGYAGLPVVITAGVRPESRGVPTGQVSFADAGTVVATAPVQGGVATGTYLSPAAGTHSLTASYGGDSNFLASASAPLVVTVSTMPDFALAVRGSATQAVQGGLIATYTLMVSGVGGEFTGDVVLSSTPLPTGALVSFAPPVVVPGAGSATVVMSVQTTTAMASRGMSVGWWALAVPLVLLLRRRRVAVLGALSLVLLAGCGARTLPASSQPSHSYNVTVTGTGTNLAGAVVQHAVGVVLVVE